MGETSLRNKELNVRGLGLLLLVSGGILAFMFVYLPYVDILDGDKSINLSTKGVVGAVMGSGIGLPYTLFGTRAENMLGHPQHPTGLQWLYGAVLFGAGLALHWWLNRVLAAHG